MIELIRTTIKRLGMFVLSFLIACCFLAGFALYKYKPTITKYKEESRAILNTIDEDTFKMLNPTQIIRRDGTTVREFSPKDYYYLESNEIPKMVKDAFISIEDKNFYKHSGIDPKAILRASVALVKNKGNITQGGSTITQQLIKLTLLTNEKTYDRKIKEIFLALGLEDKIGKETILKHYINNIYFANGAYGIGTASQYYFSKDINELSLAQISFLAAIPNNPTIYNPLTNKENTIKRQTLILDNMLEDGFILETQYHEAINEEIDFNIKQKKEYVPEDYEVSFVMNSAIKEIMANRGFQIRYKFQNNQEREAYQADYNVKFSEINEEIRQGGYTIVSTIDPLKQQNLQDSINKGLLKFTKLSPEGLYQTQGAAVVLDNKNKELVAIVGGRTAKGQVNTFNRAALAYRQPGSTMKPIVAYGIEAEIGMLGYTIYVDEKDEKGPKNFDGVYRGKVTAREALKQSINTIPFDIVKKRGPKLAMEYLYKMQFSKLVDEDKNAGLAIGGLTYGATPLEMAGAYATLANQGNFVKMNGISEIYYKDKLVYKNNKETIPVYKEGSAYLMTDILKEAVNADNRHKLKGNIIAAGKTGTTNDNKDGWFIGYTTNYTTSVWVGNDTPSTVNGLYGASYPGAIWKDIMDKLHKGLSPEDFKEPEGTETVYVTPGTEKAYIDYKWGRKKEIVPAHMLDKVNIVGYKHKVNMPSSVEISEIEEEKDISQPIEDLVDLSEPEEVLKDEDQDKVDLIKRRIDSALGAKVGTAIDLNVVLRELEAVAREIESLPSSSSKEDLRIYLQKAESLFKDQFSHLLSNFNEGLGTFGSGLFG